MKRNKEGGKNVRNGRGRTKAGQEFAFRPAAVLQFSHINRGTTTRSSLATLDQSQMCLDLHLYIRCLNFRLQLGEWMHLKKPLVASPEHSDSDCTYDAGQLERDHNANKKIITTIKIKRAKRITGVGAARKRPHCSSRWCSLPPYSHKRSSLLQSSLTLQSKHMQGC